MRYLSLFSGACGGDLAMQHLLGFECVGYVEFEPYCQKVIRQRIEDGLLDAAPIFGDIRDFISENYAHSYQGVVDVITGGFPCQDISISSAGRGGGITGERSGLWKAMAQVIRIVRPRFAFVENSPMLTIRGLGTVLGDLAEMGFDARWGVLGARHVGLPHKRDRIFIFADSAGLRGSRVEAIKKIRSTPVNCECSQWRSSIPMDLYPFMEPFNPTTSDGISRIDDGLSEAMDRLRCCGNAQVPQVVATAWRVLTCES